MHNKKLGVFVGIPSYNRPENVKRMQELCGEDVTWFLRTEEQADLYTKAGAKHVLLPDTPWLTNGDLPRKRNQIQRVAWNMGLPCVQISDDLQKIEQAIEVPGDPIETGARHGKFGGLDIIDTDFPSAIKFMLTIMDKFPDLKLAGIPPTSNLFHRGEAVSTHLFCVADLIIVKPCDIWHDERIKIKHDYDLTAAHIVKYGGVVRVNDVLCTFQHYSNKGGVVDHRKSGKVDEQGKNDKEQRDIACLKENWPAEKYPNLITDHRTRPNEVTLNGKKLARYDGIYSLRGLSRLTSEEKERRYAALHPGYVPGGKKTVDGEDEGQEEGSTRSKKAAKAPRESSSKLTPSSRERLLQELPRVRVARDYRASVVEDRRKSLERAEAEYDKYAKRHDEIIAALGEFAPAEEKTKEDSLLPQESQELPTNMEEVDTAEPPPSAAVTEEETIELMFEASVPKVEAPLSAQPVTTNPTATVRASAWD